MIVLEYTIKCIWTLQVPESVRFEMFGPVKREAGERPARSRRCERGVRVSAAGELVKSYKPGKGGVCHWEDSREDETERGYSSQKTCL